MNQKTKARLGVVASFAAATMLIGVSAPAYADPSVGTFPALVGVGSDTTQDLVGGLGTVIPAIGSYDATPVPSTIVTRSGGVSYVRPKNSGAGVAALSASINASGTQLFPDGTGVSITGQVDFARSSGGANSTTYPGSELTFIPFALDAVTYAVPAASDFPRDVPLGVTADADSAYTLRNIYRGKITSYEDAGGNAITITPLLPASGSGTRSFWLSKLGLIEANVTGIISDTKVIGGVTKTIQEHDGSYIFAKGDIAPFSVAQYIAQGNYASLSSVIERRGNIQLGNIGSRKPYLLNTSGGTEINPVFPVTRTVYNVVQTSRLSTAGVAADTLLQATFKGAGSSVCTATATIKAYGFNTVSNCGDTTTAANKQGYRTNF